MLTPLRLMAVAALPALFAATPTLAQDATGPGGGERVNQVIVYGDDPCPAAQGEDIVVCGRLAEDERYRIPETLRGNPNDPRREGWSARVLAVERVGRNGTDSCTPTGLGGFTGCVSQMIAAAEAERAETSRTDWTQAVSEERRRRMEGYDAAAGEMEAQITADEAARAAREAAAAEAAEGESVDAEPLPAPTPR